MIAVITIYLITYSCFRKIPRRSVFLLIENSLYGSFSISINPMLYHKYTKIGFLFQISSILFLTYGISGN